MSTTLTRPTESQLRGFTREGVEALSRAKGEPDWVLEQRLAAWDIYEATPMPTQQDEEWRRTSLRALKLDQVQPFGPQQSVVANLDELPTAVREGVSLEGRAGLLVQHNSGLVYAWVSDELKAQGVILMGLDQAVSEHPELVKRYFMSDAVSAGHDKFSALHGAFWSGGTFLYVPRNVNIETPIQTRVYADADAPAVFAHTLIVVEDNASAVFIDEFTSPTAENGQGFSNGAIELYTGANGHLR
jgi:Fe-S cluster assembly scaffold protein SufB